jgi:hypothetical protein
MLMTGKSIRILTVVLAFLGVLVLLPSTGLADTLTFDGVYNSSAVMGGVYDSPYWISISGINNGNPVLAICDDYTTEVASSWNANELTLSQLGSTGPQKFYDTSTNPYQNLANTNITLDYEAAALLASELLAPSILNDSANGYYWAGVYSYAIWTIFDTNAIDGWGGTTPMSSASDIEKVQAAAFTAVESGTGVSFSIYTPTPNSGASQEFIVVNTPEASSLANLAVDLLLLAGAVFFVRRRRLTSGLSN